MQSVYRLIAQCAPTNSTVLLTGESGTGKELIARAIHYNSLRKDKPFVAGRLQLAEREPAGERAVRPRQGRLHRRGVEQEGHVRGRRRRHAVPRRDRQLLAGDPGQAPARASRSANSSAVGDTRTQAANFRLITATNKDLKAMVAAGTFREDLFYRINIFPIHVPPLRERREDIPALAFHFLKVFSEELGKKVTEISEGAMSVLMNYDWPGNVRELENTLHRAVILATDHVDPPGPSRQHRRAWSPQLDVDVPRTGEELKRVKKVAREKSVEDDREAASCSKRSSATPGT